jgi:GAF domain-containing protein
MDAGVPEVVGRQSRLRSLASLGVNPESSAEALDRIAATACRLLDAPVVLVNLVGADKQRFVGCAGSDPSFSTVREMPLTHGFCPFALGADYAFAFADARSDPKLAADPVVEQLGVRAYAGVPLRAADGEPVGTLCAIDVEPHQWTEADLELLTDLAASAAAELQLLAATRRAERQHGRVRTLTALSSALVPASSPREVLDEVAPVIGRLEPSAVWLWLRDESGDELRTAAGAGFAGADARVPLELVGGGEPGFLPTRDDVRECFAPVLEPVPEAGSVALLPLGAGEACLGVLGVSFADERALSAEDRDYLAAIAGLSGLALTRASA